MSIPILTNRHFQLVSIICNIFATSLIIVLPSINASNSFTPVNCYDCSSSSSSDTSAQSTNSVYASNDVDDSSNRKGQYVGSVMNAQLDNQVSLHGDNSYSTQYDSSSSSLHGLSGGYSATNTNKFPEDKPSVHDKYSMSKYHKSGNKEKLSFPTNFGGNSFGSIPNPLNGPGGRPFGGPGASPFGGLGGRPFGGPGSFQGAGGFPPFGGPPFGNGPGPIAPGGATGSLNGLAGGIGQSNSFGGFSGSGASFQGGTLGGRPGIPSFGGIPGSISGSASGTSQVSNPNGIPQILGQQVFGEMENGVGEVVQPAQTELKPEVVQSGVIGDSSINSDSFVQPQVDYGSSGYFYGYPTSNYQQPLPDITELPIIAPVPTSIVPITNPEGGSPPVPIPLPPPVYGYYYIGRKAWYAPLYFCVYFIVYVGCLILKDLYRHNSNYPQQLYHNVIENSRKNNETEQSLTNFFMKAFDKFNTKKF